MTDSDTTYDGTETDWLANCVYGYGIGYTPEQALTEMARNVTIDSTTEVELIEHVGDARMGPGGAEVETLVSGQRLTLEPDALTDSGFRGAAIDAHVTAEALLADAETEDIER